MGYSITDAQCNGAKERWAVTYRVFGDLRFISHRDIMTLFERAIARAALPVRYTEGFNPHSRLSIALPRPVGIASETEVIVIEFGQPMDGGEIQEQLSRQMPGGIEICESRRLDAGERMTPVAVVYSLDIEDTEAPTLEDSVRRLLETESILVERTLHKNGHKRTFNARPFIADAYLADQTLYFTLKVTHEGTLRPSEFAMLLGWDDPSIHHRIRRTRVEWSKEKKRAQQSHDNTEIHGANRNEETRSQET